MKLSIAIATYNEEKKLGDCLSSVESWADEIVLVDGGSSDRTLAIAKKYNARIIKTDNPPIFHINKQKALDACRGDWILQIDADEEVTPELKNEIIGTINNKQKTACGYYIPRKNYFCGRWLRKGGQYPDYVIRLVRRGNARFPSRSVHEQISVNGQVGYLVNPLLHYSYISILEYWRKANTYILLSVEEYKTKKLPLNLLTYVEYNFFKPIVTFFSIFIRHKGFVDGIWGFLFALFSALHHPMAYMRYLKSTITMNNKRKFISLSFCLLFIAYCLLPNQFANASYVLPYPSVMPGNKLYRVSRLLDAVKKYWYWGNLASFRYELEQSDKALVEAKTLFEYNQYLLAVGALKRSNAALQRVPDTLIRAKSEGKNIEKYSQEFVGAMDEHKLLLVKIIKQVPEEFTWAPEKSAPQILYLHKLLAESERLRNEIITKFP